MQSRRSWLADCSRLSLAWLAGPAFARSAGAVEVRLISGAFRSGKLLSEVEFDGQAVTCLVDTGSAISILSEEGPWNEYPSTGKIRFTSASGGIREADKIRIAEVRVGRTVWRNVELGRLNRTPGVQSTLGIDVLARAPFSLHFQQRVALELEAVMPAEVSQRLEVSSHGVFPLRRSSARNQCARCSTPVRVFPRSTPNSPPGTPAIFPKAATSWPARTASARR